MNIKLLKPTTEAQKATQTTSDTWEFSPDQAASWKLPPFQREKRINAKVLLLAEKIKAEGGILPGTITIGVLEKERYLVDGQHRREAFYLSECLTGYADVRVLYFDSMAEMAEEYVNVNSKLVAMKPDDIMRGLEGSYEALAKIRKRCPFVGYDMIRRGDKSPILGMSMLLRCWIGSSTDTPKSGGHSATEIARTLSMEEADTAIRFMNCAWTAWGRDKTNTRLWAGLNLTICMWLYRRIVLTAHSTKTHRINDEMFTKCLMSVSAGEVYVDWLLGRNMGTRDLAPAYDRVKRIFAGRLEQETGKKPLMPAPTWASSGGQTRK